MLAAIYRRTLPLFTDGQLQLLPKTPQAWVLVNKTNAREK